MQSQFQTLSLNIERSVLGDARQVSEATGVKQSEVLRLFMAAGAARVRSLVLERAEPTEKDKQDG